MPPRIQPHQIRTPSASQCFRTRPGALPESISPHQRRYQWHKSGPPPKTKCTFLRREMWEWLHGPGKALRNPIPGSTNYMSAYDKRGNLIRTRRQREEQRDTKAFKDVQVIPIEEEAEAQRQDKLAGLDESEIKAKAEKRAAARFAKQEAEARNTVPKERPQDLRPFPLNPNFTSQSVLSESLREEVYKQVVNAGVDISTVSAAFGIDMRRVAAVVRLKTIEKQWIADGKRLAKPYNDAVLEMLPQTPYNPNDIREHESINDLPVHPSTRQQLFYPVSESRQFTREDAAKAFKDDLLPADKRIPHPELIILEKEALSKIPREVRHKNQQERDTIALEAKEKAAAAKKAWEERTQRIVPTRRWEFKFQDISAEKVGKNGRSREGVGARYGMPHEDRKRGMVKIPTSVD